MHIRSFIAAAALLSTTLAASAAPQADQRIMRGHISFLADDALEGRETGSRGYDVAAAYVASQFAQFGVIPKGE